MTVPPSNVSSVRHNLSLGVVAVVGAGLSVSARHPSAAGLAALLWDALDADPNARGAFPAVLASIPFT
jgi:hypothetical protein